MEVDRPELVYDREKATTGSMVTVLNGEKETIVIERDETGAMMTRSSMHACSPKNPVTTLVMQSIETNGLMVREDEEVTEISNEFGFLDYLKTLAPFRIQYCGFTTIVVAVLSKKTGRYSKYHYDNSTGKFINATSIGCSMCNSVTSEDDLIPKYSVHSKVLDTRVIHCFNCLSEKNEQYTYNSATNEFEQVYCKELVYDARRATNTTLDVFAKDNGTVLISRTIDETIQKEKYCSLTKEYVILRAARVKTFAVKIEEERQKKLDEKEQLKVQDQENPKDKQILEIKLEMEKIKKSLEQRDRKIMRHESEQYVMGVELDCAKEELNESRMKIKEANDYCSKLNAEKSQSLIASMETKKQNKNLKKSLAEKEKLIEKLKVEITEKTTQGKSGQMRGRNLIFHFSNILFTKIISEHSVHHRNVNPVSKTNARPSPRNMEEVFGVTYPPQYAGTARVTAAAWAPKKPSNDRISVQVPLEYWQHNRRCE